MDNVDTQLTTRRGLRIGVVLLLLPALLWLTGCDDTGGTNQRPDAEFSTSTDGLEATFTNNSSDPDGEVASVSWEFGDGEESSEESPTHTYDQEGTYDVTLTVTDDGGKTDDVTEQVRVAPNRVTTPEYVNYDTTGSGTNRTVVFEERDGNSRGVVPADPSNNPNVRENYIKWTSDLTWVISGRTFVNDGDTLEIEPGTVVKGRSNDDPSNASVLIVEDGGTIIADGNPGSDDPSQADPIIFTAEEDDVDDPDDLGDNLDGAWGGVIILGNGPKNFPGERNVEGIPTDVERATFGSDNPDPNYDAGTFRFASIRYGGISIGAGNEINGLTMGALGSETTIEYVEVYNNSDDGFEWFGGNVNANHLVASRVGDDSYDIDQGFNGSLQFLLAIQSQGRGDRTGEHDSGDDGYGGSDEGDIPVARPPIFNATYLGSGGLDRDDDGSPDGEADISLKLRDNFGGKYYNSVFLGFPTDFIEIEDLDSGPDSRNQFESENLRIENNTLFQFWEYDQATGGVNPWREVVENGGTFGQNVANYLESNNTYGDPGIERNAPDRVTTLVPPGGNSAVTGPTTAPPNAVIEDVDYRGAFEPGGDNWASWTFSAEKGIIPGGN